MRIIQATILICLTSFLNIAHSQLDKFSTLTINLSQPNLNGIDFPFDGPFFLDGDVADECYKIDFMYKIRADEKKKDKNWISFPPKDATIGFKCDPWIRNNTSQKKFLLLCPGVHPNMHYTLEFTLYKNLPTDEKKQKELKDKIATVLKTFFTAHANSAITPVHITTLETSINQTIKTFFTIDGTTKFLRQKATPTIDYSFNINSSFSSSVSVITAQTFLLAGAYANLNDAPGPPVTPGLLTLLKNEMASQGLGFITAYDNLTSDKLKLNKFSKELLLTTTAPGLADFKDHKLLDGLKILRSLFLNGANLDPIFTGTKKIANTSFASTDKKHFESIYYLESVLSDVSDGIVKDTIAGNTAHNVFSALSGSNLKNLITRIATEYRKIEACEKALESINAKLPDLTTELISVESQIADIISFPDVVSENTPYISAEGGVGYSTAFGAAYNYFGANFYLSPINKKTQLNKFKKWNLVKKMICFNIGIANFFGDRPKNSKSLLGSSGSDLVLGVGFRLGRVLKLNISSLPYRTSHENPLLDKFKTKADLCFSIGVDVNILKAFSDVAKGLNLIK